MSKVVVIGGGAAGMMAAIFAAKNGHQVSLYEKNEKLGKKLFITGKGRCNLTNACELEDLFQNIISNPKFLYSSLYSFDNQAVMSFFEEAGCKLKTERGDRVFPSSDHSAEVIKTLQNQLQAYRVEVMLNANVKAICQKKERITGIVVQIRHKEITIEADAVILATGGISYPLTGSTGDGYRMAEKIGHTITPLVPALVPLSIKEEWCKELQGLSLKNVQVAIRIEEKEIYQGFGEMLFTHYGVSGPLILSASSYLAKCAKRENTRLSIDLKPALTQEQLDKRLLRDFEESKNKQFKNAITGLFPAKLTPIMIALSGINPDKKVNEITREERVKFVQKIKNWDMTITGLRDYNEAIITQGGVNVKEINPSTLESKKVQNLFFAGEIMDIDALTGGFNLQLAWSTAYLAGSSVS